ncbi:hypothetical protein PACTADRAFT_49483 [Pachysolen tannophilus NRRL Y-2460]|uniref:GPI transamidase component GAA1 n=1 Tax=Pachysolen tannophilus NRRL Y-2460 TaxID=669874 RepID=A0A1E4TWF6_PACTA|nr:hypothetical protein PACTADRAFT_49483 [Pachysolen tannophilus NRRL Y-2460]
MALIEKIRRAFERYDLVPKLKKSLSSISILLTIVGIVWILVLPIKGQFRNTYISENALMPSQAYSFFRESEWNILRGYRSEVVKLESLPITARNDVLEIWLKSLGYKTSKHQYHELHSNKSSGDTGENFYAIMHAPRGDDTEAMVLAAPWVTSDGEFNTGGISLAVSMANYFSRLSIWSKNIIILIPEDNKYALRSWVEAYHNSLDKTAGSIESAIVMEYPSDGDHLEYIEVEYEGLNGQLPNLDFVNCAVFIGEHEGFKISLQNTPVSKLTSNTYFDRLAILLKGIKNLAISGVRKSNGCESFSGWNIQSITIRAKGVNGSHDITKYGRVVEALFRSVNNLLEKFHQSFFFYLMLQPRNFVSIGTYLPSVGIIAVGFAFMSLNSFFNNSFTYSQMIGGLEKMCITFLVVIISSIIFGISLLVSTNHINYNLLTQFLISSCVLMSLMPIINLQTIKITAKPTFLYLFQSASYLYITMLAASLSVVHFALAFSIAVLCLPLLFVKVQQTTMIKLQPFINSIALLLSCPWFSIVLLYYSLKDFDSMSSITRNLLTSWSELQSWTWFVIIFGWLPAWLCFVITGSILPLPQVEHAERKKLPVITSSSSIKKKEK